MEKDSSILELIEKLSAELTDDFEIVDFWSADLCAIGICGSNSAIRLVYVSTYSQPTGQYYYECQLSESRESMEKGNYRIVREGQAKDFTAFLKILKLYLYNLNSEGN